MINKAIIKVNSKKDIEIVNEMINGTEDLYQVEPPPSGIEEVSGIELSEQGEWIAAFCKVVEDEEILYEKKMEKQIFFREIELQDAVKNTDINLIKEKSKRYGPLFWECNALCFIPHISVAGSQYRYEGASLEEKDGEKVLTVYVSYSTKEMQKCLANYYFFIQFANWDVEDVSEIQLVRMERKE